MLLTHYTKKPLFFIIWFLIFSSASSQVKIFVDPHTTNSIKGHLELNRQKYFNISSGGKNFEKAVGNSKLLKTYLDDYKINFGRDLGMVRSQVKYGNSV
ncbi:hypothetical protein, partial [Seonamhaeicola marinus]